MDLLFIAKQLQYWGVKGFVVDEIQSKMFKQLLCFSSVHGMKMGSKFLFSKLYNLNNFTWA